MKTRISFFTALTTLALVACSGNGKLATVSTGTYTTYPDTKTVQCEGYVESDGGEAVVDRGICYIKGSGTPTVADNRVSAGSGKGSFSAILEKIDKGTYTYCAFATNSVGIAYGSPSTFTMGSKSTTGGGGGGSSSQYSLSDFIGTYDCSAYNWDGDKNEQWSGVVIDTFSAKWSNGVYVEGLLWGYSYFTALGQYDETNQCIRLYDGWHFTDRSFIFTGSDTVYMASFFPVYASKSATNFNLISSGDGYEGCGEAWLTFDGNGKLCLGAAETADENGNYANGMVWRYYLNEEPYTYMGRFSAYIDIELSKTSSSVSAPRRMPLKATTAKHNSFSVIDTHATTSRTPYQRK